MRYYSVYEESAKRGWFVVCGYRGFIIVTDGERYSVWDVDDGPIGPLFDHLGHAACFVDFLLGEETETHYGIQS